MRRLCFGSCLLLLAAAGAAPAGEERVTYHYDAGGRLTAAVYAWGSTNAAAQYACDAGGNCTNRTGLGRGDTSTDRDGDGLPDLPELVYFGHLGENAAGDPDGDRLATGIELGCGANPTLRNTDGDPQDDFEEWVADTAAADASSYFHIAGISNLPPLRVYFRASSNCVYRLERADDIRAGGWTAVTGQDGVPVPGPAGFLADTNAAPRRVYRVVVDRP